MEKSVLTLRAALLVKKMKVSRINVLMMKMMFDRSVYVILKRC